MQTFTPTGYLAAESLASSVLPKLFPQASPITIFDVGACDALDSIRYSRLFPQARVIAFEPRPDNIAQAHAYCSEFGGANITIVPCALSDRAGTATLHLSEGRPSTPLATECPDWDFGNKSSSILEPDMTRISKEWPWLGFKRTIEVMTTTIDDYCEANAIAKIEFMHLDVQGAEMLVLKGAAKYIDKITAIWVEVSNTRFYRGQPIASELGEYLKAKGFYRYGLRASGSQGDELYVRQGRIRITLSRLISWLRFFGGKTKR